MGLPTATAERLFVHWPAAVALASWASLCLQLERVGLKVKHHVLFEPCVTAWKGDVNRKAASLKYHILFVPHIIKLFSNRRLYQHITRKDKRVSSCFTSVAPVETYTAFYMSCLRTLVAELYRSRCSGKNVRVILYSCTILNTTPRAICYRNILSTYIQASSGASMDVSAN